MARRKINERNTRSLSRNGGSYFVTLPMEAIRTFGWQKKQKLVVEVDYRNSQLIIQDWTKR